MTSKELLALKAVCYGCNKNKKCGDGATFVIYEDIVNNNLNIKEEITFYEALKIMYEFIDNIEVENDNS